MVNPTGSKTKQRTKKLLAECAGRLLELRGNTQPRWMAAAGPAVYAGAPAQNPAYRLARVPTVPL